MKDASLAFKSDHTKLSNTPGEHRDLFVAKLADQYGLTGDKRDAFERRMKDAFDNDIQHRKP